jgi:hypothetical protein
MKRRGWVTAERDYQVCMDNDLRGTGSMPTGRYYVEVERSWHDYETGGRMVGRLVYASDKLIAKQAGTTGYGAEGTHYEPDTVYFAARDFVGEDTVEGGVLHTLADRERLAAEILEPRDADEVYVGLGDFDGGTDA